MRKRKFMKTASPLMDLLCDKDVLIQILRALGHARRAPIPKDYRASEWALECCDYEKLRAELLALMAKEEDEAATSKDVALRNLQDQLWKRESEGVIAMYERAAWKAGATTAETEALFRERPR
jgi:hypothetical protein